MTTYNNNNYNNNKVSSVLPPPPIFKPKFVSMQRSNSTIGLQTPGSSTDSIGSFKDNKFTFSNNNSKFLTSSFVSNEEYKSNFLNHSPSISPMTRYTDIPFNDEDLENNTTNNNNTNNNNDLSSNLKASSRKRRKSSLINNSKEEIEKKKKELKTQHSIIEKRRRIKMNREFEALKFLVPACRLNIIDGLNDSNNFDNSNMMHKLTILQSTVEYIKYLHLIIKLMKLQMLIPKETRENFKNWFQKNDNLKFVNFDLDLESYRDIENDFDFEKILLKIWENNGDVPNEWLDPITKEISKVLETDSTTTNNNIINDNNNNYFSNYQKLSLSNPVIQTPSSALQEKIQENSMYRRSILQLQNDSKSFKLPLPAIIDKHPDITCLNNNNISISSSSSSSSLSSSSSSSSSSSNLSNLSSSSPLRTNKISLPPIDKNSTFVYTKNNYTLHKNIPEHAAPIHKPYSKNIIKSNAPMVAINNETSMNINKIDTTSPEIRAASHLLMEFKTQQKKQKHPSISNILN